MIFLTILGVLMSSGNFFFESAVEEQVFVINEIDGALLLLAIVVVVAVVAGISCCGSGTADTSARAVSVTMMYTGVWLMFSGGSYALLASIPYFGIAFYILLSLTYVLGVFKRIAAGV